MAGKKDFGGVPTKPKSVEDFMRSDTDATPEASASRGKPEEKPRPIASTKKEPKADQLAKWGTYTVQRGYRMPIALMEALQGYVGERQKADRRYSETQAVCEAVTKFLEEKGISV